MAPRVHIAFTSQARVLELFYATAVVTLYPVVEAQGRETSSRIARPVT